MKKRTVILLALALTFSLAACGNKVEDVESATTDTSVVEVTEEPEIEVTEESIEETKEEVIKESTEEVIEESTEEVIEESVEETTEETPGVVEEESTSETKPDVEANVGGDNGNGGNETTPVETPPTVEPEPTTPVTPPSSGNGDNLSFSGSTTLPSGLTINTLNEFNGAGMDTNLNNSWFGDVNSNVAAQNYETMANNFDAFNNVYASAINVTSHKSIEWRASLADATGALELCKCDDHYKIIIRGPYLDLATAQSMGWAGLDSYRVAMSQEALTVLLSTISSTPQSLSDAIVSTLYTAPAGQEPIDTNGNWTSIGDCRIRLGAYDFENGNHMVVFRIAP